MHDRGVERRGRLDQFIVGTFDARTAENGDGLCAVEDFGRPAARTRGERR